MKSFKKLFAVLATTAIVASIMPVAYGAGFSDELIGAYDYAYGMGITTQGSIDSANMYGTLIRSHMAKMMVAYAKEAGKTADTSIKVNFTDVAGQSAELQTAMTEAAQMGLMGLNSDGSVATKFNPTGVVTRAQFGTVLDRVINGDANNGSEPYYAAHLSALKDAGVMNNISNPNANEVRGYVMLMMQRADDSSTTTPATCSTAENILACTLGTSACPTECEDTPVVENADGNLSVKLAASNGADVPYGIPSLEVVTYKFTADADVRIDSLVLDRVGYSDSNTLDGVALFINGGRVSKITSKFNSDDQATVAITNGYEIKAGQTVEITVNVSVKNDVAVAGDQFAIKLDSVSSTAKDVNIASDVTSDTFKVLSKPNAEITYTNGSSVDAPKVGNESDLFEFVLNNGSTQDSTLKAITFKDGSGSIDENTDLKNFSLVVDGETIATASALVGKYLTFNIADGYQIEKAKKATFTVKADVVDGANETINFVLDNAMDVTVIGDTYDVPMSVSATFPAYTKATTVSAGKVAIAKVIADAGDLVRNRDNIFLGAFTVTNNADQSLNLEDLKFDIANSSGVLDNVKVKLGSTTASPIDLTQGTLTHQNEWSETDLGKSIGSKLTVYVYADTADVVMPSSIKMVLNSVRILENVNDTAINDITPSSLTWSTIVGQTSNGTLTKVVLGDKTVSQGTEGVDAMQFKIKAGDAYGTKVKQITFDAVGTGIVDGDTVAGATLYNGTTAIPATVKTNSIVIDDDFTVAAGTTSTFTLKLDLASSPESTGFRYDLSGAKIDAEDLSSDKNDVTFSTLVDGRIITIVSAGTMESSYDSTIANNKYAKNILGGESAIVGEYSVYSKYEAINVDTAAVTFSTATKDSVLDVQLYYGDEMVASDPTWNLAKTVASFDNLDFDTATAKKALTVKIVSKIIGEENGNVSLADTYVDSIALGGLKGKDSGDDVSAFTLLDNSSNFNIVPVTLTPAITMLGSNKGTFTIEAKNGLNEATDGNEVKATLSGVLLSIITNAELTSVTIKNEATGISTSKAVSGTNDYTVDVTSVLSNGTTEFTITPITTDYSKANYTVSLKGISYTTNVAPSTKINAAIGNTKDMLTK